MQLHFYKTAETTFARSHVELFLSTKKLHKTELQGNVAEYIKRFCSRRRGSPRQLVNSYFKTEQKMSKKETKSLTYALQRNAEQSWDNSTDGKREATNYQNKT